MKVQQSVLLQATPLGDLLDLRSFTEVCHSFAELYRIGVKVFDDAGNKLVDVKIGNADFCGYLWQTADGRSQCMATVQRVKTEPLPDEPPQVPVHRAHGHAGHRDLLLLAPRREREPERARGRLRVVEEELVEVPHAEEEERARRLRLRVQVLPHHGGLGHGGSKPTAARGQRKVKNATVDVRNLLIACEL